MAIEYYDSVWDAIEDTPEGAEHAAALRARRGLLAVLRSGML